jgi:hypothetical protein
MTRLPLDHAVLRYAAAQIAQPNGIYDSKTGQTGQPGQRIEHKQELSAISGWDARNCAPKLASRTADWPIPACDVSPHIGAAHAPPQNRVPSR